jgi:uncharacterized protein (TIGR02118 family)
MAHEDFHQYWREHHGPLVRKHAEALRIKRYIQCHTLASELNNMFQQGRGGLEPYDGTAELWWESAEVMIEAMSSPEGQTAGQILLEDEKRFIDHENSSLFLAEEYPVIPS